MSFTFAFHYEVKCPDTPGRFSDVELLDTDISELDLAGATVQQSGEKIAIPDTQYDSDFWRDVDDEGVGGHSRY